MTLPKQKKLTHLAATIVLLILALGMSITSGMFNYEGGEMIGSMLSPQFADSLKYTMIIIEVLIIISYGVNKHLNTSRITRLETTLSVSSLSIICLTILFYTGIIERYEDFNKADATVAQESEKQTNLNNEIQTLQDKINTRQKWINEERASLTKNDTQIQKLQRKINKRLSPVSSCPSKKYARRCRDANAWKQQIKEIESQVNSQKVRDLQTEIEKYQAKIDEKKRMESVSKAYGTKKQQQANDNQGILRFKPVSMKIETFSAIFALFWAISLEFLKSLPIFWFWEFALKTQKSAQKKRIDPYGKKRMGLVWLIRKIFERKNELAEIKVKAQAKAKGKEEARIENERQEKAENEKKRQDESKFFITVWMKNITVPQLKDVAENQLNARRIRTPMETFAAMVCLSLKTYEENQQVKINELVDQIHEEYPESKGRGRLTYAMMRDKIFPLLVEDLRFIKRTENGFYWKDEMGVIAARNSRDAGWVTRNYKKQKAPTAKPHLSIVKTDTDAPQQLQLGAFG